MKALLASLLVVTAALVSGCIGGEPASDSSDPSATDSSATDTTGTEPGSTSTGGPTSSGTSSPTSSGAPGENAAPEVTLSASNMSGSVPLSVVFTVNGTDADGDAISFTLSIGKNTIGEGESVPADVSYTFEAAGDYVVNLTASDGEAEATANVTISVTAPEAPSGPASLTGSVTARCNNTCEALGPNACRDFIQHTQGTECIYFPITAEHKGLQFSMTSTGGDPDLWWVNTCTFPSDVTTQTDSNAVGPESGTVPATAGCVVMFEYSPTVPSVITMDFL